jgi:hypothetical protein
MEGVDSNKNHWFISETKVHFDGSICVVKMASHHAGARILAGCAQGECASRHGRIVACWWQYRRFAIWQPVMLCRTAGFGHMSLTTAT